MVKFAVFVSVLLSLLYSSLSVPVNDDFISKNDVQPDPSVVRFVDTTLGTVMGNALTFTIPGYLTVFSFMAIPYGQDTSGANRFKKPLPAEPWGEDILDVSKTGRIAQYGCLQLNATNPAATQGTEDCLRLHVYTKELGPDVKLPVMVFIHGGGFTVGDGQLYTHLKLLNEDVVLVFIQYRLGVLGFLSTDTEENPGNMGLYDQLLGLQWVRDNIANFGGDPDLVTIFGESAGATSVALHISSELSAGLFHRAIIQSGCAMASWSIEEDPLEYHESYSQLTGCPWDASDPASYVECLRGVDGYSLIYQQFVMQKNERLSGRHGFRGVSPVVEKHGGSSRFISDKPINKLNQGLFNRVPTIVGSVKHEGSYPLGLYYNDYLLPNNYVNNTNYIEFEIMHFFMEVLEVFDETSVVESALDYKYLRNLDRNIFNDVMPGLIDFIGATLLKAGGYNQAKLMSKHDTPVWVYSFDYSGEYTFFDIFFPNPIPIPNGITHGDDLLYMFAYPVNLNAEDQAVSDQILSLWSTFAKFGNPTPIDNWWPQFERNDPQYMRMESTFTIQNDFATQYTIAVDELMAGIPIPDHTPDMSGKAAYRREKLVRYLDNLREGRLEWNEDDEVAVKAAVKQGGTEAANKFSMNLL